MNKKPNYKLYFAIGLIVLCLVAFGLAPVVEITVKDKYNNILAQSTHRLVLESQSLVPSLLPLYSEDQVAKTEVNVITGQKKLYYICEDVVPKTLEEVKALCTYSGTDNPPEIISKG
jgi:hypothetical protein